MPHAYCQLEEAAVVPEESWELWVGPLDTPASLGMRPLPLRIPPPRRIAAERCDAGGASSRLADALPMFITFLSDDDDDEIDVMPELLNFHGMAGQTATVSPIPSATRPARAVPR